MSDERKDLNRIKSVLVENHRTCKWLAEQLGKDPTTVSKWCTNASQPTLDILLKIAELVGVNYTELVCHEFQKKG
jgi:DNA-binding XRE family transcriptional regulator